MEEGMAIADYTAITMAISTFVLVCITFYYAIINKKILDENIKINSEYLRPYVYANIYSKDLYIQLSIQNVGRGVAKSIEIKFTPDLSFIEKTSKQPPKDDGNWVDHKPMLKQAFFPPEFNINTILAYNPDFLSDTKAPQKFHVCCKYKDLDDKEYKAEYDISLASIVYRKKIAEFSDEYFWRELYKKLDTMNQTINKWNL